MADTKLTALAAATTAAETDLVYIVTGVGGSPASKGMTVANLRALLLNFITIPQATATLSSDTFTATSSFMTVDTEAAAATDNCTTINSGSAAIGTILFMRTANAARDITLVDGTPLRLNGNCTLGTTTDFIMLMCVNTNVWAEVSRSVNG